MWLWGWIVFNRGLHGLVGFLGDEAKEVVFGWTYYLGESLS